MNNLRIIVVGDGDTDYLFLEKAVRDDPELSALPISVIRPEDVGLKRRVGGGHKTLLKEAGLAAIRSAQGFAEAVLVLVDNDGDGRFRFPHRQHCGNCRECEASEALEKVGWGQPFRKGAAILFQAVETLILSAKQDIGFTPQLEESLYSTALKVRLYGREIHDMAEMYDAFREALEETDVKKIRARSYPHKKKILTEMVS